MSATVTPEQMDADAQTAHTIENMRLKAQGINTLADDQGRAAFLLGFADGAMWAITNTNNILKGRGQDETK